MRVPASPPTDGSVQALDQIAQWVRFADTKATVLTAGLGVVLTMLMTNAKTIVSAMQLGCPEAYILGMLVSLAAASASYTLWWLMRAIGPSRMVQLNGVNRFSWPTLVHTSLDDLLAHAVDVEASADAWRQVLDLSRLADRKFLACERAVRGFGSLVVFATACAASAAAITA